MTFTRETYIFVQNSMQGEFIYLGTRSEDKRTKAGNPVPVYPILKILAPPSGNSFRVMTCSNLSKAHELRSELTTPSRTSQEVKRLLSVLDTS